MQIHKRARHKNLLTWTVFQLYIKRVDSAGEAGEPKTGVDDVPDSFDTSVGELVDVATAADLSCVRGQCIGYGVGTRPVEPKDIVGLDSYVNCGRHGHRPNFHWGGGYCANQLITGRGTSHRAPYHQHHLKLQWMGPVILVLITGATILGWGLLSKIRVKFHVS